MNFSPQPLKPNCTPARPPSPSVRKIGPESRAQESSSGSSETSTPSPQSRRASAAWRGSATISTGSNAAIALATAACSASAAGKRSCHIVSRAGQHMIVRSCGAHSAGMRILIAS